MTPGEFQKGGKNLQIDFTIKPSHFGEAFIASTEKGICSIQFTENPIAFLIPYHRVIQSSGSIGEYHWNSDRKAAYTKLGSFTFFLT